MAEKTFRHSLYYPDNHSISLSDIAATLLAHEKLLPIIAEILERSVDGLTIEKIDIKVDHIRSSSLSEAFFVAIFLVFQKDLQEEVPALLEAMTGAAIDDRFDTLITVLFIIAIYYGAKLLLERKKGVQPGVAQPTIQGNYNTYINIAAKALEVPPERVERAVESATGKKRRPTLMKAAIELFRPAKRGGNGRIIPGEGLPEIGKDAVAEFPNEVALAELDDDTVPVPVSDAILQIRASDRDKSDRGWAGILISEQFKTKRLPVQLYPTVDRELLAGQDSVVVEAVVEHKIEDDGDMRPIKIHVLGLSGQAGELATPRRLLGGG